MSDHGLSAVVTVLATVVVWAAAVFWVTRRVRRSRPDLSLHRPLLTAYALRFTSAAILGLTSLNTSARGVDDTTFLYDAHALARLPFSSHQWVAALTGHLWIADNYNAGTLHVFVMALQIRAFGSTELALRTTMAAISVIGIGLIAVAVYELAGPRPAKLTAWLLAIEPANVFFSTALHKEPLLYLAVGMVGLGAALAWKRLRIQALVLMAVGSLVATATATYVGWFLAAGSLAVMLHIGTRRLSTRARWAVGLGTLAVSGGLIAVPTVAQRVQTELSGLQDSQNKNANLHARLGLEHVDFRTPATVVINLPRRMWDLMLRPYPWQLSDTNQRLGMIETLFVLALIVMFAHAIFVRRRFIRESLPPLAYPTLFLWIAYSLAVANAGTGFRYRTQIVPLMIAMIFVLEARPRKPGAPEPAASLALSRT